jgi:ribA/ribD-fused uncharacterized protein
MMAEKARLFTDVATRQRILETDDPRLHKRLGREVQGFVQELWEAQRSRIVVAGNTAKFGQNPQMLSDLLATGTRTLVEASPLDRVWGIGLRGDDPRALDPKQWRGKNLLGLALMEVRSYFAAASRVPE